MLGRDVVGHFLSTANIDIYVPLNTALRNTLPNSCILIFDGTSVAILSVNQNFYIFDSHSRNLSGEPTGNGTSVLLQFQSIDDLIHHLEEYAVKYRITQFDLTPVDVVSLALNIDMHALYQYQGYSCEINIRDDVHFRCMHSNLPKNSSSTSNIAINMPMAQSQSAEHSVKELMSSTTCPTNEIELLLCCLVLAVNKNPATWNEHDITEAVKSSQLMSVDISDFLDDRKTYWTFVTAYEKNMSIHALNSISVVQDKIFDILTSSFDYACDCNSFILFFNARDAVDIKVL